MNALEAEERQAYTAALGTFGNILTKSRSPAADDFNRAVAKMLPRERLMLGRMMAETAKGLYRD